MPRAKTPATIENSSWQDINDDIANSAVVVIGSDNDDYVPPVEPNEGGEKA